MNRGGGQKIKPKEIKYSLHLHTLYCISQWYYKRKHKYTLEEDLKKWDYI